MQKGIYFVFIIHQVNKHGVSRRLVTETEVKHFNSGTLRTNIIRGIVNWKKEFLHRCISRILFVDTEQLSKMQISSQVFFKDFVDRFGNAYLKNGFIWSCFSRILLIDFRTASSVKAASSKKYYCKILFIDSKTSATKIIYFKVHYTIHAYMHTCIHAYIHE